jgi:hypothetical protein
MSGQTSDNPYSAKWSLYANPELLCVRVQKGEDAGWVKVTLESEPELATDVGTTDGVRFVQEGVENDEPSRLYRLSLSLKLEEIPRLVAVLNEIYLANHDEAVQTLEFGNSDDWGERRMKSGHLSIVPVRPTHLPALTCQPSTRCRRHRSSGVLRRSVLTASHRAPVLSPCSTLGPCHVLPRMQDRVPPWL